MASKFIEAPVYEHAFRSSSDITSQLINTDHIIRVYRSDSRDYIGDTFLELKRGFNANEPIRIAVPYEEVAKILIR